ncbi:hypothetical protein A2415_05230 [candidate division WWE3 bacterium RIFOXYC1_FULL_39_7]|uniref:O-antigen ligase-related domain-containing protein n=1 Tax=candidate division WWE3 bacterium RIFOXYC1_FULL_39_7 TaxID=1802643 RepID=A0A1F4WJB6_UNCKA|nr:MAG: hypothetical protein A2415_05230 [candidate division WWE3 bacterium RIFOXYC1_FULL_39_7]
MRKLFGGLKDQNFKYLVVMLLFVVPLFPKFPLFSIPGSQVALRLEDFVIFGVSLVWLWREFPKIGRIFADKITRSIVLFWAAGLVSLLSALLISQTVSPHVATLHWVRRVEYMMAFFIGVSALRSKEELVFFVRALLLVAVYLFVVGIGQKHFGWPVITTQNLEYAKGIALRYEDGGHLVSTFAGHYDLATFLILVLPFWFVMFFSSEKFLPKGLERTRLLAVILMGLWLLVNTASRISIVSYVGATGLSLLLIRKYRAIVIMIVLSLVFVSFSSRLLERYDRIFQVVTEKISDRIGGMIEVSAASLPTQMSGFVLGDVEIFEDRSTSIRLNMEWPRAVRALTKNPLLGTGYSSITLATDNDYLRMLGEVGMLGFAAFGLIVVRIGTRLVVGFWRMKESLEKLYLAGMIGSLTGVGLNMVFIDILEASKFAMMFWLMMGFAVAMARNYEKN